MTPPEVTQMLPDARLQGQGIFRFFGFAVYRIKLWTGPGFEAERFDAHPFVLELEYERKLEGIAIAERSIEEMHRLREFDEAQSKKWLAAMMKAFPNVKERDRLSGAYAPGGATRFFFNGQLSGNVDDAAFGPLFFGIWLSPKTTAQDLRLSLIGAARH